MSIAHLIDHLTLVTIS